MIKLIDKVSSAFAGSDAIYFCKAKLDDYQFFKQELKKVEIILLFCKIAKFIFIATFLAIIS